MKRAKLWVTAALVLAPASALAQRDARPRNIVVIHPLSLITGYLDLEYERALGDFFSLYAAPGAIFSRTRYLDGTSSLGVFSASLDVGGRIFPLRRSPSGFFIDLGFGAYGSNFNAEYRERGLGWRGLVGLGYTLVLGGHFVASLGAGAQFTSFKPDRGATESEVYPTLRFALGGAF